MKQITITLPDVDASKFVAQLMDMNVTFTVTTTVARDPMVFAALETPRVGEPQAAKGPPDPDREKDPARVELGREAAKAGPPIYTRGDRRYNRPIHVQRLTPDGRTSMQVIESKIHQAAGRKVTVQEVIALANYSGFKPDTLFHQLQILVARGRMVKINKYTWREVPPEVKPAGKRASPLPSGSHPELPLTGEDASTLPSNSPEDAATFVSGEGWVQ